MPQGRQGKRLDLLVTELGLVENRQAAVFAIMDGGILVNGKQITKPGVPIATDAKIEIAPGWGAPKYASRGGLKLEKALQEFAVNPNGWICIDIGASTGGFTDCLLKHGALKVYAIDVGYGQLDWKLRQDKRVIVKEKVNARYLTPESLYAPGESIAQLAVIDVSFISVLKILPACLPLLDQENTQIVCLIKPQFEAGRKSISKGGVVRSKGTHIEVLTSVLTQAEELGLKPHGLTFSPIKGPAGNIEYLVYWKQELLSSKSELISNIPELVESTFNTLG